MYSSLEVMRSILLTKKIYLLNLNLRTQLEAGNQDSCCIVWIYPENCNFVPEFKPQC